MRHLRHPVPARGLPRFVRIVLWSSLLPLALDAQPYRSVPGGDCSGDRVFVEVVTGVPGSSARVDILARVLPGFMVFTRASNLHPDSAFSAGVELSLDVLNVSNKSVVSVFEHGVMYAGEPGGGPATGVLLQRTLFLPAGKYALSWTARDRNSERLLRGKRAFTVKVRHEAPVLGSVIPVIKDSMHTGMKVICFGGNLLFNTPYRIAIPAQVSSDASWTFSLNTQGEGREKREVVRLQRTPESVWPGMTPVNEGHSFLMMEDETMQGKTFVFDLPLDTLDFGQYEFVAIAREEGRSDTTVQRLCLLWRDVPYALENLDQAMSLMRYILLEDEFTRMDSGSDEERRAKLNKYWKERDPSPDTAYNELLDEYFRRADEADRLYKTLTRPYGSLTDRGKVHMLYGPPEDVQRILEPGQRAQEVWHYPSLKRVFVFTDRDRNGNLRLVQ